MLLSKKSFLMNFGPQHPSAHGVLRLILETKGELVMEADPHIGLLHRGTEKLMETRAPLQNLGYLDRLDYVSTISLEHAYCLNIEKLYNQSLMERALPAMIIPKRAQYVRVLLAEITRILNHLLALTTHAMDLGALSPFLWHFEERERLLSLCELLSGARMHTYFLRPGGIAFDLPNQWLEEFTKFFHSFDKRIADSYKILSYNRIFQNRTINIGIINENLIRDMGFSGPILRGSGIPYDIRKEIPYENYDEFNFKIPVGANGDCFDRFNIRALEIATSTDIINQCLTNLPEGNIMSDTFYISKNLQRKTMEDLIKFFKHYSCEAIVLPSESTYNCVEAPKGEFGVLTLTDPVKTNKHYRCHLRAPGFYHLAGLRHLSRKIPLSDLVAIIGTLDLVFGEIDR
jgi:NADH:ubiquinone oxidoreductase subunit D